MNQTTIERLSQDLRTLALDGEQLLSSDGADDSIGEKAREIRDRLAGALETAEETMETVNRTVCTGAKLADKAIRDKPYHALGIALVAGFLIALILRRD